MKSKLRTAGSRSKVAAGVANSAKATQRDRDSAQNRERKAVRQALRRIDSRLAAMTSHIEDIKAGPIDRFVAQAVAELEEGPWGEVLTELYRLDDASDSGKREAADVFDQLKMLRRALFSALGIRPLLAPKKMRMSTSRALSYRWGDDAPMPAARSCSFEVISPGWLRGDTVLLPPKIRPVRSSAAAGAPPTQRRAEPVVSRNPAARSGPDGSPV